MGAFEGKVAIVTGSSSGIGAETAKKLAAGGAKVVVNYSASKPGAEAVADAIRSAGGEALIVQGNVSEDEACQKLAKAAIDAWGRIDILVNNAGTSKVVPHGDLDGLDAAEFQRIYAVNVIGPYQMIRACAPAMRAAGGGSVVNVSSIAGVVAIGSSVAYIASKAALNGVTLALARALAPDIRVNAVCPGFVDTNWFRAKLGAAEADALRDRAAASAPLKMAGTPEKIADGILFFASDASGLTTGETLLLDAGSHLGFGGLKIK